VTSPGWYHAEGDAAGSQRYWDGTQWLGEAVYEPAPTPDLTPGPTMYPPSPRVPESPQYPPTQYPPPMAAPGHTYQQPAPSKYHSAVKPLVIILTVLKAIPLVIALFGVVIIGALLNAWEDDTFQDNSAFDGWDFGGLFGAAIAFLVAIILVGILLLGLHLAGALTERPLMLFIPAVLMALLDSLVTVGSWASFFDGRESPVGPFFMTALTVAQIFVAVQAVRAMRA